ncbi:MAG: hypothetical protein US62_C0042G0008 [Candidatus Woesebacteria bacterium GW2011_GWA1_37_8]|uniref:Uncharacterized protein n=2 Tax=Candidatus Woeseibacteriota TaxID=1752722 RepID=A0A0G0L599_9BACT|nr:MAG: hypothetical protein US39_C0003G0008 [Microgenomates group bacterium GW2011_GWC1_37_12b]KKQ43781.1 MAG: hypothetical protein US62_C0042G0008 [Candidatus Woesebacteria bacterium GW2011_GWA1_37_8]KKQ87153.1 MAG: hypothetical protein UT10_C0010G0028 [Candidatus Woesebacteria bacterium GW2011_GWB1_38_8b]
MKQAIKSAGDKARAAAAQTTKQIAQELLEIPKQAGAEAVGVKTPGTFPDVLEKPAQSQTPTYDPNKKEPEDQNRLDYLERELEDLKRKRELEKQQKAYEETEVKKREDEENQKRMQAIISPPKRKLRMPSFGQKKSKGTGEMLKSSK